MGAPQQHPQQVVQPNAPALWTVAPQPTPQQTLQPDAPTFEWSGKSGASKFLLQTADETIHPTVVGVINGEPVRMLLDTAAGSNYISSTIANHLGTHPVFWEDKSTETMTGVVKQRLPVFSVDIYSTDMKFKLSIKANKLDRTVITTLPNPKISMLKTKYSGAHVHRLD